MYAFRTHTHTHTRLMALCPGLPRWAGTRKVKPIWILLKQETVNGSGISWAICKSAPRSRQITTPATHYSVFYRPDALPATQPIASKHWRQYAFRTHNTIPNRTWLTGCHVNFVLLLFWKWMLGLLGTNCDKLDALHDTQPLVWKHWC